MLIERTAPVVCEARKAFQVSWAAVAPISRLRNGPHACGVQRLEMPSPVRSIWTATRVAPWWVSAAARVAKACFCSVQ